METSGAVAQPDGQLSPDTMPASLPGDGFRSGGGEAFGAISRGAVGLPGSGSHEASLPVWGSGGSGPSQVCAGGCIPCD